MYWTGIWITVVLLVAYGLLLVMYRKWFVNLPLFHPNYHHPPQTHFSVIIPARNEEAGIRACLLSVLEQDYPTALWELIVINDHSTDGTESIIRSLQNEYPNLKLLNLAEVIQEENINAYKKKAIETAIARSEGDWIVTTDADCTVTPKWLGLLDAYIRQNDSVFIAAPVMFFNRNSFLDKFQLLDFMSLQGITAAAVSAGYHTMCNGANIAYQKAAFYAVGQFRGIDHLASGDDMLLMNKIKKQYPGKIKYLFHRDAIVWTTAMPDWKSFLNQRIRWASKAEVYTDRSIFWVLLLVYAVNAFLLVLLLVSPWAERGLGNWLWLVLTKTLVELYFLVPVARFYRMVGALLWFPFMQPFHIFYTVLAGWLGKFGSYQWKGRKVK